ncbi:MAG: ABC transporter ATP-binding protein [Lachnospiraceae bacterium]|nr:ABC transporter ATP-binding protein [Lachnospiraceae bacterium]
MIEVKGITKRYGSHTAVDNLSFTMETGRIYGFLGPNGAGKSTTMNIMTGYIAANEGTVLVNGVDIIRKPEAAKKQIGYLPELPPLYQEMTVLEYLLFVAELKKIPKKERRDQIARVLKMTMLGDYQERLIRNLSKGYKQRVGLAQALIGFPEIIILDEPTVGLDPQQILEIRDLIRSLKSDHIIMLSSHILSEVNEVCDEVMILSHGKLVASGSPAELEAKMQKKSSLNLTVLGDEESTRAALAAVPGIDQMTFGETAEDGALSAVLESDGDTDIRTEVARALAAAAIPVTGMQLETRSLEDVFLELTGSDEAVDEDTEAGEGEGKEELS